MILRSLNSRIALSKANQQNYYSLQRGYEGEQMFDEMINKGSFEGLVLNDLLFKQNNQTFQIDSLIIFKNSIHIFEVKNFIGNYHYKTDQIIQINQNEISNPLIQLSRTESLLRQLLVKYNYSIPIQAAVVYINPEFTLYQAPSDKPYIFPTQLKRFMKKLNTEQSKLSDLHLNLSERLLTLHMTENPYLQLPSYDFQNLHKGITCEVCFSILTTIRGKKCVCTHCGHEELAETAILRTVKEFQLLFPNEKITTNRIFEWCGIISQKQRIQRVLKKHFQLSGVHQWTHYV